MCPCVEYKLCVNTSLSQSEVLIEAGRTHFQSLSFSPKPLLRLAFLLLEHKRHA